MQRNLKLFDEGKFDLRQSKRATLNSSKISQKILSEQQACTQRRSGAIYGASQHLRSDSNLTNIYDKALIHTHGRYA